MDKKAKAKGQGWSLEMGEGIGESVMCWRAGVREESVCLMGGRGYCDSREPFTLMECWCNFP